MVRELIIESLPDTENKYSPSTVIANETSKTLKVNIRNKDVQFKQEDLDKLRFWLKAFKEKYGLGKINLENYSCVYPLQSYTVPSTCWEYLPCYINHFTQVDEVIAEFCDVIKLPDVVFKKPNLHRPGFICEYSCNYIALYGECYTSYVTEVFAPIFNWVEAYLKTKPKEIRVEIWADYYNTPTFRRLEELIAGLEKYQLAYKHSNVKVFWYHDIDNYNETKEDGESFREMHPNLDFQVVGYDDELYKRMSKRFV